MTPVYLLYHSHLLSIFLAVIIIRYFSILTVSFTFIVRIFLAVIIIGYFSVLTACIIAYFLL